MFPAPPWQPTALTPTVTIAPPATFTSIAPDSGDDAQAVVITGTDFASGLAVTFDGVTATSIVVASATSITCNVPAHADGAVDIVITNPGTESVTASGAFTYTSLAAPTFTSIAPASGDDGSAVVITGTNFVSGATVAFDGSSATSVVFVSSTTINCNIPTHADGVVDIVITNPDAQSVTASGAFTYTTDAPAFTSIAPVSGDDGQAVTITGTGFVSGVIVAFDGQAATSVVFISSTTIQCNVPSHADGVVDIVITNPDAQFVTASGAFTYTTAVPGDAPQFGDDPNDELIFSDDFESYDSMNSGGVEVYDAPWAGHVSEVELDDGGGRGGGKAIYRNIDAGTGGAKFWRDVPDVAHFFLEYWFKLGAGDHVDWGKWLIVHHDMEMVTGCLGNGMVRHQFAITKEHDAFVAGGDKDWGSLSTRSEVNSGCDGPPSNPVNGTGVGFFNWSADPQDSAPVHSGDPAIGNAPWNPLNDGNYHKHTIEIKSGDGTNGYVRLWMDGFSYWDSSAGLMNYPGVAKQILWEPVSGPSHNAYEVWLDDITVWKR